MIHSPRLHSERAPAAEYINIMGSSNLWGFILSWAVHGVVSVYLSNTYWYAGIQATSNPVEEAIHWWYKISTAFTEMRHLNNLLL